MCVKQENDLSNFDQGNNWVRTRPELQVLLVFWSAVEVALKTWIKFIILLTADEGSQDIFSGVFRSLSFSLLNKNFWNSIKPLCGF